MIKKLLPFFVLIALAYWVVQPFFHQGFFPMHDDTQVARVFEMHKSLTDGMFPVRWVADLGYHYGYPIFNFYAPFAYYIGGFFMLLGMDALIATKFMMGVGVVLAGIFMYLFAKQVWGTFGGIISALLYLYAPYHALNIYVRGDVAEFWAYAFIPLAFYGIWMVYTKRQWKYVVIGSLGYAGIILSHNLTAMMVTPFLVVIAFFLYVAARQEKKLHKHYYPLLIVLLGILLSSFYWLPVFAEMKYTNVLSQVGGGADYKDHFVCLPQLWDSAWGFGGSTHSCVDGLSYKIGKLHILLALFSLGTLFLLRKEKHVLFGIILIFIVSTLFSLFLMLKESQFLWDLIPQMAFFQYPWRFLLITTFFISFLGGAVSVIVKKIPRFEAIQPRGLEIGIIGVIVIGIVYLNSDLFVPQTILPKNARDYTNPLTLRFHTSKISDEYMPRGFKKPNNPNEVPEQKITAKEGVKILNIEEKTQAITAKIDVSKKTDVLIHHAYFPTWHVSLDGEQQTFKYFNRGLLVTIPEGTHTLVVRYTQTTVEKLANAFSLTGVIALLLGIIYSRKKIYERKKA